MKVQWILLVSVACVAPLAACDNNQNADVVDTGPGVDVSMVDAGNVDTGPGTDVPAVTDTGPGTDVPVVTDTGNDVPTVMDTGTGTPLNGCTTFTDLTASTATRTITFVTPAYTPKCSTITAGQTVMFSGDFTMHPLTPGRAPSRPATDSASATPNPITVTNTGATASFTFPTAGDYGFYCAVHESLGMYGVIRVQ